MHTLGLACIIIEGPDAEKFLQSQLTCDVLAIAQDQCQLSAYCNQKGYVEALFWLKRTASGFSALISAELVEHTLVLFKKYGAFSKVTFQTSVLTLDHFDLGQQDCLLQWHDTLSLALPAPALMQAQVSTSSAWHAYWLSVGIPLLTRATAGIFRPHELNLAESDVVCFTKGCYPGQEIVARMHYRGKAKAHLQQLTLSACENAPKPGDNLLLADTVTVVDCLYLENHCYALSVVMPDSAYDQLPFTCQYGELTRFNHD